MNLREQVILKLLINNELLVEQIEYINSNYLKSEIYKGQSLTKLLGEAQAQEVIKHVLEANSNEKIIISYQNERFWLKTSKKSNGFELEFSFVYPFESIAERNKISFELLDIYDDGIIVTNQFGQIIYANNSFCKMSLYSAEQLRGKMFYPIFVNLGHLDNNFNKKEHLNKLICSNNTTIPVKIVTHKIQLQENETIFAYIIKDLSLLKKNENEILYREQLLKSIFFASQQFLNSNNWRENIQLILENIGNTLQVFSVKLYENTIGQDDLLVMKLNEEWINPLFRKLHLPCKKEISYFPFYENIFAKLSKGEIYFADNDETNSHFLKSKNIDSAVLVPIFVDKQWWGFLSIEIIQALRIWEPIEIQALLQIASNIGASIFQSRIIQEQIILKNNAEQSNAIISVFLSNIGHELRTPLNSIIGFSDLIKKNIPTDSKLYEYCSHVYDNSNKLLKTIDLLVEFAKLETNNYSINKQVINIYQFLSEMVSITQHEIKKQNKQIHVQLHCSSESWEIITDKKKLKQIFEQLIDNAVKFTSYGLIELGCRKISNKYEFFVMDTGIGIDSNYQDIIVGKFRQVEKETTRSKPGIGIGLSIVNKLTSILQGELHIQSEPNKGSIFFIRFPYEIEIPQSMNQDSNTTHNPKTMYILDNDDELYFKLYTLLQQQYKNKNIVRVRNLHEIKSDAAYIIVNSNNLNVNLSNELNTINKKYPQAKVLTHQFHSKPFKQNIFTHKPNHDNFYWNILNKIKMLK